MTNCTVTACVLGILAACCVLWPALRAARGECDRHDATLARLHQTDTTPPACATWDAPPAPGELRRIEQAAKITLWLN